MRESLGLIQTMIDILKDDIKNDFRIIKIVVAFAMACYLVLCCL